MRVSLTLATTVLIAAVSMPAYSQNWTDEGEAAAKAVEQVLRDSLNDPDSLKVDLMTVFKVGGDKYHACGMLRAKNAYGGYIRQNYVITGNAPMPVYIGPIPLHVFAKDCTGEIIYSKTQ